MRILIILILLENIAFCEKETKYSCSSVSEGQCTDWGWSPDIYDYSSKPKKHLKGIVKDYLNAPINEVLIEVYQHQQPFDIDNELEKRMKIPCHQRLFSCITSERGEFSFDLPDGRYEVRASKHGWEANLAIVVIDKAVGKNKDTSLLLQRAR
jgi:hypothetical protein